MFKKLCCRLTDNQQGDIGNEVEDQKENFEQAEKRVNDHIKSLTPEREKCTLQAVDKVWRESAKNGPQN